MNWKTNRREDYDVVVIGGGTAGVFAAIAASKCGAKTILIEKNSRIGGTITNAQVNFPGLFYAWGKKIIDGPCWEAIERTVQLEGAEIPQISYQPKRHWDEQIRVNILVYTYVLNEMCREAGVHVVTNAMISAADEQEEKIHILVTDKSGIIEYNAYIAIDATGDANLAQILKYNCLKSAIQQPATLYGHLSGYRIESVNFDELQEKWKESAVSDDISAEMLMGFLKTCKIDKHIECKDADTSWGRSYLESTAIADLTRIYKFLRTIKGLENIQVEFMPSETGIRESNRIVGEKEVTAADYLKGVFYPDSICYAFYPIDLHVKDGIQNTYLKEGVIPKIPYGALIPKGAKRLICAGRCVSSDTYANSALRVQAPCMAMGQAAGCAAALAASENKCINKVPYTLLRNALETIGAIVPVEEDRV